MSKLIHVTISIAGQVQGVAFRYAAKQEADKLMLYGYAKNLPNSTVSIEVEGPKENVEEFIAWCKQGPSHASVTNIGVKAGDLQHFSDFSIKL
jgi:acylphosphatase